MNKETSKKTLRANILIVCSVSVSIFVVKVLLGVYIFKFFLNKELVDEARSDLLREGIRKVLNEKLLQTRQIQVDFTTISRYGNIFQLEEIETCCRFIKYNETKVPIILKRARRSDFWDFMKGLNPPGEKGEPGFQGAPGPIGPLGVPGSPGPVGPSGINGGKGPIGSPGPTGPAGQNGETGVEGSQGNQGVRGDPGLTGPTGLDGAPGQNGVPGLPGTNGPKGETGFPGLAGNKGETGQNGVAGMKGETGDKGSKGISGQDGKMGVIGSPGVKGNIGERGLQGLFGSKGELGLNGLPGLKGQLGESGAPGAKGWKGDLGSRGFTGLKGEQGSTPMPGLKGEVGEVSPNPGSNGQKGDDGNSGKQGSKGETGGDGYPGIKGQTGETRSPGIQGKDGRKGVPGNPGPKGQIGDRGFTGAPGESGKTGLSGLDGAAGRNGEPGKNGTDGIPGRPGVKGEKGLLGLSGKNAKTKEKTNSFILPKYQNVECQKYFCTNEDGNLGPRGPLGVPGPIGPSGKLKPLVKLQPSDLRWEVEPYGQQVYPGLPKRLEECFLIEIQHGVGQKIKLVDSCQTGNKYWLTTANVSTLQEYVEDELTPIKVYDLYPGFQGDSYVVYKNSFFYKANHARPRIVKFVLDNETSQVINVPGSAWKNLETLYKSGADFFDFNIDENGLWVIFPVPASKNTAVMKIDADRMEIQTILNITANHRLYDDMFIAFGVLYAIEGSSIKTALDLYTNQLISVDLDIDILGSMKGASYDSREKNIVVVYKNKLAESFPVVCVKDQEEVPVE